MSTEHKHTEAKTMPVVALALAACWAAANQLPMQNETQPESTEPKVDDHAKQYQTDSAPSGAHDAPTAESSPCRSSDRARPNAGTVSKPKYLTEAINEARELINKGFTVDETVVRALLRGVAEAYGETYEPVYRCSLDKPAVFDHDNMNRL